MGSQLFHKGKIFTSDPENLHADAMLVRDGTVAWVGCLPEDWRTAGIRTGHGRIVPESDLDLGGRTVIPGLIDAHMHPLMLADYSRQIACLPPDINSIEDLKAAIRRVHDEKIAEWRDGEPVPWILGWGYDEGKYAEGRQPDRYDLDEASPDLPVFLVRSCEHIRCVNSKALAIAGISRDTPDPPGGELGRDDRGEPTGILKENARDLVLPYMTEETKEDRIRALAELSELLTSQGITGITDMGNLHAGGNYELYLAAAGKGFRQRVSLYYMWDYFMDDPGFRIRPEDMAYDKRIRMAGLKLIGDGSVSGQTAWMYEPFSGGQNGFPVYSDESLEKALSFAKSCGCQISVHAMGGRAIDRVIDRMYGEKDWTDGTVPFVRIEHVTEPTDRAMERAAEKGIAFASQPIFAYCEIETYRNNMAPERLRRTYPYRRMLDRGVQLCLSTDAPATSWAVPSDPFPNLKSAVTRTAYDGTDIGQQERLTVEEAIGCYTREAAAVSGMANAGMLRAGYDADFVVLSGDIFFIDPMRIDEIRADETWIRGERCFQRR